MTLTHIDLFSGIGGFALVARWVGIKTVQFVEIDKFCHKVLNKNFPGVPIHDDIKTFTYAKSNRFGGRRSEPLYERGENGTTKFGEDISAKTHPFIITGGFPCQPYSCAGKRKGKEDDRVLWPEMLRVISEAKPYWVIGENVAGFIGMGLDDCISDLEREGYEVQAFIIPACAVNAPHRRDRVWIVGNLQSEQHTENGGIWKGKATNSIGSDNLDEQGINNDSMRFRYGKDNEIPTGRDGIIGTDSHAPYTLNEGRIGRSGGSDTDIDRIQESEQTGSESRSATSRCNEIGNAADTPQRQDNQRNGWQEPWLEVATRLCRVDDGVPRGMDRVNRLKSLGNAVVPQVVYQIMKAILEVETQ